MLSSQDRRALQSVATQFFVNGVVYASFIPRLPEIRDRIGVGLGTVGLILTLASLGGLVGSALASSAVSRFGTKRVMVIFGSLSAAALPFVGFATGPVMLWAALTTLLFFDVFTDVAMNMQGSVISGRRTVPVMNRLHGLWSVGTVLGGLAAAAMSAAGVSLQLHFIVVTIVSLLTIILVAPGLLPSDEVVDTGAEAAGGGRSSARRALAILAVLGAMAMVLEVVSGEWAAFRLSDDLDAEPGVAGLGYVAYTIGMVVGRLAGDWFVTKIGDHHLIRTATVIAGIGLVLATTVPLIPMALVGFLMAGLGNSVMFPHLYDQAAKAPGKPGAGLGAMTGGSKIGSLAAPVLVGVLASTDALTVGAAMAIVTLPAAIVIFGLRTLQARAPSANRSAP